MKRILLVTLLLILALVQVGYIVFNRSTSGDSPAPPPLWLIEAGDTLLASPEIDEDRALRRQLDEGGDGVVGLVFLAFGSECGHSRAVAGAWREWLEKDRPVHIVAITRDDDAAADAYAAAEQWSVEVLPLVDPPSGSASEALTTLTPATYLLDSNGVVHFQGHGSDLDGLDAAIEQLAASMSVEVPS